MREANATDGTVVNLNTSDWKVRASSEDKFIEGLVLNRSKGLITVPAVSGTSVDADRMRNAFGKDFLELVYLLRQEVFFAEGRRFSDLGMRLPLCEVEAAKVKTGILMLMSQCSSRHISLPICRQSNMVWMLTLLMPLTGQ